MIAKLELWAGIVLAVLAGIGVALFVGYSKGKAHAAGKVREARQKAADAVTARTTYQGASEAAAKVRQTKPAPPDVVKRDDLDNTF